ncbi:MAG: hypothetical protein GQ582_05105, partial [Methyloprofundus sp.]|nr:hypothetical protein [Methyloprofundus sp.]
MKKLIVYNVISIAVGLSFSSVVLAQANLPFPKTPSASKVGISLQESEHHWRQAAN